MYDSDREEDEEEEDDDDDDEDEEDMEELRGRMMRRRKKRKTATSTSKKKAAAPRAQPRPLSFSRPTPSTPPPCPSFQAPLAPPTTNINNNININIGRGPGSSGSRRQHCPYCGRHFRSLARHLEKHHDQQPEVRAAMELAQLHTHSSHPSAVPAATSHKLSFSSPQPSSSTASSSSVPSLFSREKDSQNGASGSGVSFSLSLSPPVAASSKKSPASLSSPSRKSTATPTPPVKSSPVTPPNPPARRGRRPKKEKVEQQKKQEEMERAKEEAPPTPGREEEEEEEEEELEMSEVREEESPEEKNGEMTSSHRPHMPPLLSSLSTLVLYLRRQQHSSFLSLSRTPNSAEAWRLLCHSSLALLILYNRHRECEVAKLTVQDYQNRVTPSAPNAASPNPAGGALPALSPLESCLSPFERHVLCHLPRVGVLGKRGRVQPLILPPHAEACLDLLLRTCSDVGVDPESPYVFSRPYHSPATPLRGTDLLRGLARSSGAKNPAALTAPRARRQVAILTQLLLLEEGERQQGAAAKRLEDFLQSEYHVTQSCARIGQDPALMGRVGRVVLYGERDGVLFRGMSLQHICLELDVMSGNSADSFSDDSEAEGEKSKERAEVGKKGAGNGKGPRPKKESSPHPMSVTPSPSGPHKKRNSQPKSGKRGVLKRPWSEAERVAVETHLKRNIMELRVPAKADCERCLQHCPLLVTNQRDWRAIKFYCHNRIQLLKKQGRREGNVATVC
ncbi:splicing factor, arginine/serine-rich 19 [Chanos chanos]|uniref:Splicing factor, arginine/serine-rich 19 n=1 Tax=Chanos chanos TaxID=29144 RepID=A0A6J2VQR7_CHACN|nr:splicing factor, arginine/serine-rich 19-like [Chanos chanos]